MSLINNMLKNLDERERTSKYHPVITLAHTKKRLQAFSAMNKPFLATAGITIVLALCLIRFFPSPANTANHIVPVVQAPQPSTSNSALPSGVNDTWTGKLTIKGISLQEKENITEISFMFDHPALYRLVSNDMANQLSIIFDNASLDASLPSVSSRSSGINMIRTIPINHGVSVNLHLNPGIIIKNIDNSNDKHNPELVIDIEHAPIAKQSPSTTSTDIIKMPAMESLFAQQYETALKLAESGNYQEAITKLNSLIKASPAFQDARVSLAALLIDQGYGKSASKIIDEGLKLAPDAIPLIELKARILTADGNVKGALQLLQSQSPAITDNPEYNAFVAALYQKNDNDLLAVRLYKKLLSLDPQNGNWWFGLGLSLEKLGENVSAYQAYNKAITVGNINPDSMNMLQSHLQSLQETVDES